jgi:hypothetical protein
MGKADIDPTVVADGAAAASAQTLDAIERAAERNEDPEVAEILEDASIAADTTLVRIGWVRSLVHRLFGTSHA